MKWDKIFRGAPPKLRYELVESEIDAEHFRQGIRLLDPEHEGIIVTISPRVKLNVINDTLNVSFDFEVEANPNEKLISKKELHQFLGPIIIDMIQKDINAPGNSDTEHPTEGQ